jgi:hypothetical protein
MTVIPALVIAADGDSGRRPLSSETASRVPAAFHGLSLCPRYAISISCRRTSPRFSRSSAPSRMRYPLLTVPRHIRTTSCGDGHRKLARSLEDSVLDHFQIAVHVKRIGLVPRGPDANREVWTGGIAAIE